MTVTMPRTLTLVRHGESESNAAKSSAIKGTAHEREAELMSVHTSQRRLTERGIQQAHEAGLWLSEHFLQEAQRRGEQQFRNVHGFVSPYVRALETAGHLGLPIVWRVDARLAERNWGDLDQLTHEQRLAKYGSLHERKQHGIFWPAGNGETLQMLSTRMWQHFDMLTRRHPEDDVVEVSHGETMLTQRFMLERWLPEDVARMMLAAGTHSAEGADNTNTDWQNKIINCRIVQYTREREDGTWDNKYCRVRLIAPSAPNDPRMNLDWTPIVRRTFTTHELLQYAGQFPCFLRT